MQDRMPVAAAAAEFDSQFIQDFGNPADGNALVLPLVVRDKVAAFVYADAGTEADSKIDSSALQLLTRDAGLWLELLALRKSGGAAAAPGMAPEHSPAESMISPTEKVVESEIAASAPMAAAAPTPEEPKAHEPVIAPGDEEVHKKARRFAKLLVDEIKLYNQAKVSEGRENRDLYDRLREDIEKSRATYDKRYGQTPAADGDYFNQELVRILADNDPAIFGDNFPR